MCSEGAVVLSTMKGAVAAPESHHGLKPFTVVIMVVVAMFSVWLSHIPNAPWSSTCFFHCPNIRISRRIDSIHVHCIDMPLLYPVTLRFFL